LNGFSLPGGLTQTPDLRRSVMARRLMVLLLAACGLFVVSEQTLAVSGLTDIVNYREYSKTFSSSGQPKPVQFKLLQEAGFERVVFLAFTDHHDSVANEDRMVKQLGMEYVQIPVIWDKPRLEDFTAFAAIMRQGRGKKTLVHCQVNFRASTFSFLYRVLFEDVAMDQAKDDMNSVWVPNETWRKFIFSVLEENGRSPHCDHCLWESD
jgi:protein tyrosine phosphatase (PTP) superfamily phosphohydrolase (DUF442 family)